MKLRSTTLTGVMTLSVFLLAGSASVRAVEHEAAETIFVRRLAPLLSEKCLACHGNDESKIKGGLDLRTLAASLKGGDSGKPALVQGKPEQSPVYLAVTRTETDWEPMPPKEADKLTTEQIGWIRDWIASGAPWPDQSRVRELTQANANKWSAEDGVTVKTSGGLSHEWTNRKYKPEGLWAYQPLKLKGNIPIVTRDHEQLQTSRNPIDTLILAKLAPGMKPAPTADRLTLIRRATFDLTGLPPTPEEVEAFLKDEAPDAFAKVVERLLASPHYGERMAQHWLDVVRYADSSGFANDYERGNAWRYRDYVVRSFNQDKPFDQFIRQQIAGDEIAPEDPEAIIATGFLRMGPWELTSMEVPKIARQRFLDDVVSSVGETFLAHSLQCARCHDHKFDPVPTRDYYSLQAVFATTQLAERPVPFLTTENTNGFAEREYLEQRSREYRALLKEVNARKTVGAARRWLKDQGRNPAEFEKAVSEISAQMEVPTENVPLEEIRKLMQERKVHPDLIPPQHVGFTPQDFGNQRVAYKGLERLRWESERYEPFALAVFSGRTPDVDSVLSPTRMPPARLTSGELEETCILTGGNPFAQGEKVKPGVLSVLENEQKTAIPNSIERRRKTFADWVASADNPLTTRTIANRIWLWHLGEPLAGNPNNFGSTGKKPTHPELLDWLASTFIEQGWSFKAMHRVIMNSDVYQRSAATIDKNSSNHDSPTFRPRRLSAEELRDAMLAASGELNPTLGGIPNRPELNLEVALQPRQVMGTFASAWTPNPLPEQRHRRSLYALKLRGLPDPSLEVFNAPGPDFSCERREASTVTPQVFNLFNGQNTHSRALALAHRALKETKNDNDAIVRCFLLTLSRRPNPKELESCLVHWREIEAMLSDAPPSPKPPLEVRRDAVEENTGEKFSFIEKLHSNRDFVADLQPADVARHTRALADVCLVLFNSNEFIYVY